MAAPPPKKNFHLANKISDPNGKTTFPREFFLEIWLKIEDCKYNYTAEIKFEKIIRWRVYGENKF